MGNIHDGSPRKTALGVAKARFIEALPRRSKELEAAIKLLSESPEQSHLYEEMRRRLHALYASAQVFQQEVLAAALKNRIELLDSARDARRDLTREDIDALAEAASSLMKLASGEGEAPARISKTPLPLSSPAPFSSAAYQTVDRQSKAGRS